MNATGEWWRAREVMVGLTLGGVLAMLGVLAPTFFAMGPLLSMWAREAPVLLVAGGMAVVILGRQIDISVGSQFSVVSVVAGLLLAEGWPWPVVCGVGLVAGVVMGGVNGFLVAGLGLPSIVVTLATMVTWREGLRWLRQGVFVNLPEGAQWFGLAQVAGQWAVVGMALVLFGVLAWCLRNLSGGRFVYAVGSDAEAARLAGISPRRVTWLVLMLMGGLTGVAAVLNVIQSPQVDPKSGTGLELRAIAAAVVGGVAVQGGRGRLGGVLLGLMLLACVGPALTHLRVNAYWEKAIQGGIILAAVVGESSGARRRS